MESFRTLTVVLTLLGLLDGLKSNKIFFKFLMENTILAANSALKYYLMTVNLR